MIPVFREGLIYRDVDTSARELKIRLDRDIWRIFGNLAYRCNRIIERGRSASSKWHRNNRGATRGACRGKNKVQTRYTEEEGQIKKKYEGNPGSLTYLKRHQNFRKFNKRAGSFHDHLPSVTQYFDGNNVRGLWCVDLFTCLFYSWRILFTLATPNWLPAAVPLERRKASETYLGGKYLVTYAQWVPCPFPSRSLKTRSV